MASRVASLRSRLAALRRACAWWAFHLLPGSAVLRHISGRTTQRPAATARKARSPPAPAVFSAARRHSCSPHLHPIKASAMAAPSGPPVFSNQELV